MVSDFDKQRAQLFQASGFSIMIPFGRLILKLLEQPIDLNINLFLSLLFSLLLFLCGIMLLLKALECVETRRIK